MVPWYMHPRQLRPRTTATDDKCAQWLIAPTAMSHILFIHSDASIRFPNDQISKLLFYWGMIPPSFPLPHSTCNCKIFHICQHIYGHFKTIKTILKISRLFRWTVHKQEFNKQWLNFKMYIYYLGILALCE